MSAPLAWYNEPDRHAAQWLRNLIDAGAIAPGVVDERSIEDVRPDDLAPFRQCHFFAGIGVWSRALRLAGWPDDRSVWTGSCPCQPFSAAGKGLGFADERHLWPAWFHLVTQRTRRAHGDRPNGDGRQLNVLFGEQVASGGSAEWIRLVRSDLEGLGNTVGILPIEAASAGADHLRDRYWWTAVDLADRNSRGLEERTQLNGHALHDAADGNSRGRYVDGRGDLGSVADAQRTERRSSTEGRHELDGANARREETSSGRLLHSEARNVDDTTKRAGQSVIARATERSVPPGNDATNWIIGTDGKARRVKPGIRLLAHGTAGRLDFVRPTEPGEPEAPVHTYSRVGALKGFGNAIDPRPATAWIRTVMEWIDATGGTRY